MRDQGFKSTGTGFRPRAWRSSARARRRPGKARTRKPRIRSMRSSARLQDRAGLLLRHARRTTAASRPSSPKTARSTKSKPAPKRKSCWTARRSTPNPAARWRTPARSSTTRERSKSPKCAARIIPSAGWSRTASSRRKTCAWATAWPRVADPVRRARNMRNHTATHLMHAALRNILGTHVKQAGSLVAPDHLRFDFSHFAAVDPSELAEIEQQVNEEILRELRIADRHHEYRRRARLRRARFLRRQISRSTTSAWSPFPIPRRRAASTARSFAAARTCTAPAKSASSRFVAEQSAAAGVRRIEAITGDRALAEYQRAHHHAARRGRTAEHRRRRSSSPPLERQLDRSQAARKAARRPRSARLPARRPTIWSSEAQEVKGVRVVAAKVDGCRPRSPAADGRYAAPEAGLRRGGPWGPPTTAKWL